jgi:hypothetical protein
VALCRQCKHWLDSENLGSLTQSLAFWDVTKITMHLSSPKCELIYPSSAILPKMLAQALVANFYPGTPRLKSPPEHRKSKAIPLLPLWAFAACCRVNFTFTFTHAPNNLTQIFHGFLQSLQANSAFAVVDRARPSPFTSLPSDNSLSSILSC